MDLHRLISVIRAWFPLLVLSVVLAAGAAYLVSGILPKTYEAKATLLVGQSLSAVNPDFTQLEVSARLATTYASIAGKRPILDAVIKDLGLDTTADDLATKVRAEAELDSAFLTISAQDVDPEQAAAIANSLAEQLLAASPAIQGRQVEFQSSIDDALKATQAEIDDSQARATVLNALTAPTPAEAAELTTLEGRLVSLRATYATLLTFSSGNVSNLLSVIEPAVAPLAPVSPKPILNTVLAAVLGLLLAIGIIVLAEYLDDKVKDPETVREVSDLNTMGTIGRMKGDRRSEIYRLATILYPRSGVAEAYRTLRANIEFAFVDSPQSTILVTSSVPGEGKTVTASNLAVAFAQSGRRVLLVDADLRKPGVHLLFDLPNAQGLASLLRNDAISLDAVAQATEQPNLRVVTTGPLPPNPAELLGSKRMRTILDRLKANSDVVIFDSPPLHAVTDAAILSSFLDGTLLVIDARHSRQKSVRLGRAALARAGARMLGAVLNRSGAASNADFADYYGSEAGPDRTVSDAGDASGRLRT